VRVLGLAVSLLAGGCGGGEGLPPAGTPAAGAEPPPPVEVAVSDTAAAQEAAPLDETQLLREAFSYRGSGRDPFISPVKSGEARPLLEDLRVTSITYDPRFPSNSVAVLRDTTVNQRYTVRVGDELGRMRVVEIRPREIVVIVDEFGVERQVVLQQRRRQEEVP
jgi:hypothetical protein